MRRLCQAQTTQLIVRRFGSRRGRNEELLPLEVTAVTVRPLKQSNIELLSGANLPLKFVLLKNQLNWKALLSIFHLYRRVFCTFFFGKNWTGIWMFVRERREKSTVSDEGWQPCVLREQGLSGNNSTIKLEKTSFGQPEHYLSRTANEILWDLTYGILRTS